MGSAATVKRARPVSGRIVELRIRPTLLRETVERQKLINNPPWRSQTPRVIPEALSALRRKHASRLLRRANRNQGWPYKPQTRVWTVSNAGWVFVAYDELVHCFGPEWRPETACGKWVIAGAQFQTLKDGVAGLSCPDCKANVEYASALRAEHRRQASAAYMNRRRHGSLL